MTSTLDEIAAELAEQKTEAETLVRLQGGGLSRETEALLLKQLSAIRDARDARAAKSAPPPLAPVLPDVEKLTPAAARARADEIAKDPRFWDPSKRDAEGKRLTGEEHARLVAERSELLARASEET